MKKRAKKKVIIITVIVLILGCTVILLHYWQRPNTYDTQQYIAQQYIATRTITLPDGNSIQAQVTNDQPNVGWIGTRLTDLTPAIKQHLNYSDPYGVYVQDTFRNSPAQTAGLLPGDIITQINNAEAQEVLPTLNLISSLKPGTTYPITVYRDGKYLVYSVTVIDKQHV